jgi:hypothetical protein
MRSRAKGIEEGSTNTNNHSPISGWCFFWDSGQCNRCQASMRNFTKIKPRSWQCEKCTSIKVMWWLWKVTCAWIEEYFRILYKSIGHIQSNKKIWGENERDTCVRENLTLAAKEVLLYGGRDKKKVIKYGCSFNPRSYGKIKSPWGKSQWDSRGCGCMSIFFKVRWFWIFTRG